MAGQRLSTWVALRCKEAAFQRFLGAEDEQMAANAVRAICHIQTRAELDSNPSAAHLFHRHIRLPYADFTHHQENTRV